MAVIDTLEILIEADARGLETQLKRGSDTVLNFVKKMNSEEVNWQKILAGSLDTAIIAGVAATFAQAIGQFVQFQSAAMNLNNIATPATKDFASSVNQLGGQAYKLANDAGLQIGDATMAFEAFSKAGLTSSAAMTATTAAAGIARETGQSLSQVVEDLTGLFQSWGVVTDDQVNSALTGLTNAASMGKFSFQELVKTITTQGANLAQKTNISDVAVSLALLSDKSGLTKDAVVSTFDAIGTAATDQLNGMNMLIGNVGTQISSGPDGLITVFEKIKTRIDNTVPAARATIAQYMGLSTTDVASFSNTTIDNLKKVEKEFDDVRTHLIPWPDLLKQHESAANKLTEAWNRLVNALDQFIIPAAVSVLGKTLDGFVLIFEGINKGLTTFVGLLSGLSGSTVLKDAFKNLFSGGGVSGFLTDIAGDVVENTGKTIAQRLNNPGDLRYAGQAGATKDSSGFAKFSDFAAGFQALQNDLMAKIKRNGETTLLDFAKVYAPASDGNNPTAYAKSLAEQLGVSINTPISQLAGVIQQFARAVAFNEDRTNPNLASINKSANVQLTYNNNTKAPSLFSEAANLATQLYNAFQGLI